MSYLHRTVNSYHDDIQGVLGTALGGATQYTPRAYRSTGIVLPHIARTDIFSMVFQMPHRKTLGGAIDSVHLHFIPIASADGDIVIDYAWGWYNHNDVIPDTLPNTGSKVITLATTDQYKQKISILIANLAAPASEVYSSVLYARCTRIATGDTWGTGEIALAYMDAHFTTDRDGSLNEATD